jgi:erythromycin esterase-like protein/predicted phosphoribosyltransferase
MVDRVFRDRRDAGRVLAKLLEHYKDKPDVVVLALPRGGVPVGYEVATALGAPLDVFLVRKLGVPGREEVAMGAIASGGIVVINDDVVRGLRISAEQLQQIAEREARELLRREAVYRDGRPAPDLSGKTAVLVDDGLATGASMHAAVEALRERLPARIVVAVPAAPESSCRELERMVDEVVCASTPTPFLAVGESYWDFTQTTDEEVRELLHAAVAPSPERTGAAEPSPAALVRAQARPVSEGVPATDTLMSIVGDAQFVLIGEASHGTQEFYEARAAITRRLIEEKGFNAVAAEADWPDAYRVNRYVRGRSDDAAAEEALRDFTRFPTWMWRNTAVLDFVGWLREYNDHLEEGAMAGFYGLDLYSLRRSMEQVVAYLEEVDPAAAARARERYSCFDHSSGDDGQSYGYAAAYGAGESCEEQAVAQLVELQRLGNGASGEDGLLPEDELFYAQQNAAVVRDAEVYYRTMFGGRSSSWNLRDRHMVDTLDGLTRHLSEQRGGTAKIVVWAHNSHVGDARVTESGMRGEVTVGQLMRERHPDACRLIGFTTHTGTVTAADDWGGQAERKWVRPALPDSVEDLFHETGEKEFMLAFEVAPKAAELLSAARLERAIGVIYRPETERQSHYFRCRVSHQFDAVIHIDETRAVEPLERTARWETGELPETYPFAV